VASRWCSREVISASKRQAGGGRAASRGLHAGGSCLSEEDKVNFAEKSSALQIS
jgi:hypothetical protein